MRRLITLAVLLVAVRAQAKAGYGEVLRALDQRDRWVKVRTDAGVQGWVARSLLWGW